MMRYTLLLNVYILTSNQTAERTQGPDRADLARAVREVFDE